MKTALAALCIISLQICAAQEHRDLLDPKLRDLFHEALSGELAKEHVIAITRYHRIQGSREYREAAHYVLGKLREYGFSEQDAYIESFPSDGKARYQTWQSPSGWDIKAAELRMVEPYDERIVGYPEIAMSVITYSNAGDATAELVWVGSGESDDDYRGKDVRGKFVLATGYGGNVHRLAVLKYGAKGVVCYLDDERAAYHPDMLQYTGMWPRTDELGRVTFGFNLTNKQGGKLKGLLEAGKKVVLHGWVKGIGLEPYWMDVVVAHIRGTERPEQEFVFSAHLDHPKESANDNASGSGALLDIARTLKELTGGGRLPKPKRSFRFLWVPEWYGTMAYIDKHPELAGPGLGGTWLADMNMDMVGENEDLLHSHLIITKTPASLPSCVNDVVENMAEMVDNVDVSTPRGSLSDFSYRVTPYSGGSDHMMFIDRKVPGIMFTHTDYTHHTSEDTPDKVDPVELERCELIATGTMWYLANLDPQQAADLTYLSYRNALRTLAGGAEQSHRLSDERPLALAAREAAAGLRSVSLFLSDPDNDARIGALAADIMRQSDLLRATLKIQKRAAQTPDTRIPYRLTRGPLDFALPESELDPARAAWYASKEFTLSGDGRYELANFMDGKRTVSEIGDELSAEFGPVETAVVSRYIDDLVRIGAAAWK